MKRFLRYAQGMPPPPPPAGGEMAPPGMGGAPGAGGLPEPPPPGGGEMPAPPGGGGEMPPPPPPPGGAPGAPGAPGGAPEPVKVNSSLDTPIDILADADANDLAMSGLTLDKIRDRIWEDYGGMPGENKSKPGCVGARTDDFKQMQPDRQDKERSATEKRRWERLPQGKSITDIVGYDELKGFVSAIGMSVAKPPAPPGGGEGGGGGMPPPMAAVKTDQAMRLAGLIEGLGQRQIADKIESIIVQRASALLRNLHDK